MLVKIAAHPWFKFLTKLAVLAFCLVFIKHQLSYEFSDFSTIIKKLDLTYSSLSLACLFASFFLGAYKWKLIFNTFRPHSKYSDFLSGCFKAAFIANFMLGSIVGDGARVYDIAKKYQIPYQKSLMIALIDRALTLLFYVISACIVFLTSKFINFHTLQAQTLLGLIILMAIIYTSKAPDSILVLRAEKYQDLLNPELLFLYFLITFFSTILIGLSFIFLANATNIHLEINSLASILVGLLSNFFPLSFSGWGVRELTLTVILKNYASSDAIITVSILFGLLNAIIALPGVFIYLKNRKT